MVDDNYFGRRDNNDNARATYEFRVYLPAGGKSRTSRSTVPKRSPSHVYRKRFGPPSPSERRARVVSNNFVIINSVPTNGRVDWSAFRRSYGEYDTNNDYYASPSGPTKWRYSRTCFCATGIPVPNDRVFSVTFLAIYYFYVRPNARVPPTGFSVFVDTFKTRKVRTPALTGFEAVDL